MAYLYKTSAAPDSPASQLFHYPVQSHHPPYNHSIPTCLYQVRQWPSVYVELVPDHRNIGMRLDPGTRDAVVSVEKHEYVA